MACGCLISTATFAQTPSKAEKKESIIEKNEGNNKEKIVIEIDGNTVTINGKPAEEYTGKRIIITDDMVIMNKKNKEYSAIQGPSKMEWKGDSRPILGVFTEKTEKGLKIVRVNEKTAAEKAGLKEDDIITMINTTSVNSPEALTEAIRKHKIGDEIEITYLRDGKTQKVKATLEKSKDVFVFGYEGEEMRMNFDGPMAFSVPRAPMFKEDQLRGMMLFSNDRPKYGMSIQDDEDARGVKVTEVEAESNAAKGGLKKDDIITEIDGEKIKGVDDMREKLDSKKDLPGISLKVLRNGKTQSVSVKVPRKIKSANL
jgi:serine protease Do